MTRSGETDAGEPVPSHPLGLATPEPSVVQSLMGAGDAKLLVAIGRYSHEALEEIYRRHAGAVYGLAQRVVGNPSDAEDVTQEVLVRLWNQPDRFDSTRGSLRTFLLTETHSRAVELVRARAARARREGREARLANVTGNDLDREISDLVVVQQVADAMTRLPEEERRALELAYYHGHTYREVASLLGQPEGTVKSRIRSGLSRLRRSMTENEVAGR